MPEYPKKEMAQLVLQALVGHDIKNVVISPGSRNAPLTIAFVNHPEIETRSLVDERSAAFFALGMAQQKGIPVALLCTSGSALLNYYPAVAEAYYSRIPLIVLSADRPAHLIDIGDGQTIRQGRIFKDHILFESGLQEEVDIKENAQRIKEAIETAISRSGPVHLNIPFDEPLYETVDQLYDFGHLTKPRDADTNTDSLLNEEPIPLEELEDYASIWNNSHKKMVILGVHPPDPLIQTQLTHIAKDPSVLVLTESTSNVDNNSFIRHIDRLIFSLDQEEFEALRPEVLITFGGMVVSKKIKQFLRKFPPKHHWHIDPERAMDTFHCLERHFKISAQLFFSQFFFLTRNVDSNYQQFWLKRVDAKEKGHVEFTGKTSYSDFKVFDHVFNTIPSVARLQLSNSSVIRYSQLFSIDKRIEVFCNRGTSGIDGSTSTAVGAACSFSGQTVFVTGDLSFFYDNNALWNSNIPQDFRIIVINNGGGGIFRILPGPAKTSALSYFETPHKLDASHLCKMHGLEYLRAYDESELEEKLNDFYYPSESPRVLEIFTSSEVNDKVLKAYFDYLSKI